MLRRVKWTSVTAVLVGLGAAVAGGFGIDLEVTAPIGLLGVTLGLVARDSG